MNYIPRKSVHASVDVPPCRMVEPHLLVPIRRPANHHASPYGLRWGGVLLLERHQAAPVRTALESVATAWPQGVKRLRQATIRSPLGNLLDHHVRRFGADYAEGFYLRVEAPEPPPVFDMRNGGVEFTRRVPSGSLIQCALSLFATIGHDGQPSIGTEIEWLNLIRIESMPSQWLSPLHQAVTY